ncbi:hypothetical protein AB0I98_35445 [Streptomyces sp. NPDC050211]|uniref:hypothetical protein n=1 Tax=Streptomyces sp. NPDC050211 TaxID=3154932 RepID=UPI0034304C23
MRKRLPRYSPPVIAPKDEYDGYAIKLDLGDWCYALDCSPCIYGPGWYPFYEYVTRPVHDPSAPLAGPRDVATGQIRPTSVRISPDVEWYSWRNEYVTLFPYYNDHRVKARTRLYVQRTTVRGIEIGIDLRTEVVILPEGCPDNLQEQAEVKGRRILDFLKRARSERRRGLTAPDKVVHPGMRDDNDG